MAALEKGYTPVTPVLDAPLVLDISRGNVWKPQNISNKILWHSSIKRSLGELLQFSDDPGCSRYWNESGC